MEAPMTTVVRIAVSMVLICLFVIVAAAHNTALAQASVTICHIPPGDPANARTIVVDAHSLLAHLAHGDQSGECGNAPPCQNDGDSCGTDSDCCNGICGGSGICTSQCTVGPELGGAYCDLGLDCCDGACIYGTCW